MGVDIISCNTNKQDFHSPKYHMHEGSVRSQMKDAVAKKQANETVVAKDIPTIESFMQLHHDQPLLVNKNEISDGHLQMDNLHKQTLHQKRTGRDLNSSLSHETGHRNLISMQAEKYYNHDGSVSPEFGDNSISLNNT